MRAPPLALALALALALGLALAACTTVPPADPAPLVAPAARTAAPAPLAWEDGTPARREWSATLRAEIALRLPAFGTARDAAAFCPAWPGLPPEARVEAIAALAVGIARYESRFDPAARAGRTGRVQWVGLFQLATDGVFALCVKKAGARLDDPLANIRCAVPEMARLTAMDGFLAGGDGRKAATGIGRWWHVLRPGSGRFLDRIRAEVAAAPVCRAP